MFYDIYKRLAGPTNLHIRWKASITFLPCLVLVIHCKKLFYGKHASFLLIAFPNAYFKSDPTSSILAPKVPSRCLTVFAETPSRALAIPKTTPTDVYDCPNIADVAPVTPVGCIE